MNEQKGFGFMFKVKALKLLLFPHRFQSSRFLELGCSRQSDGFIPKLVGSLMQQMSLLLFFNEQM